MKTSLVLLVALCASYAAAAAPTCTTVTCFRDLAACQAGTDGLSTDNQCASLYPFYRCNSETNCRETSTGEVVSIRDNDCHQGIRCFDSLTACTSAASNSPAFDTGAFPRSACLPSSVFQCREQVGQQICRDVSTGYQIRQGAGAQDPHFKGFDGVTFYFEGEPDRVFNVLSDTYIQINAKFILLNELKGTYMGQLGIQYGGESLIFDPHFGVIVNGTLIVDGEHVLHGGSGALVVEAIEDRFIMSMQYGAYSIQARVQVEGGMRQAAYTNLVVNLIGEPVDPHGILGQTVNPRAGLIDGAEDDYLVVDGLLGSDFTFNRYIGEMPEDN